MTGRILRDEPTGARLPILGKIKIGEKAISKSGKGYPKAVDYFVCKGKYESHFYNVYGQNANRIQIIFISDNWADVCNEHYELRNPKNGDLMAEGDGQTWKAYDAKADAYIYGLIATVEELEKKYQCDAKVVLTLRFVLPAIPGVFGQWQFTTRGVHSSIPAIRDTFDQVQNMAGTIVNIPFDLVVEKVKSQKPGSASVFPVVSLIPNVSPTNIELLAEWREQGVTAIRGILTDEKIQKLSVNLRTLPEHVEILNQPETATVQIVDNSAENSPKTGQKEPQNEPKNNHVENSDEPQPDEPDDVPEDSPKITLLSVKQKKEIWELAKKHIFNEYTFRAYLNSKGLTDLSIDAVWYDKIIEEIRSGRAMELAMIVINDALPEVVNEQD